MFYPASQEGPFVIPFHDPDSIVEYGLLFRPDIWVAGKVYNKSDANNYDVVIPTTFKGLYHRVSNPGISNATSEPVWAKRPGDETNDFETGATDGLVWEAVAYNLLLPNESIASVTLTPSDGALIASSSSNASSCAFVTSAVPADTVARTQGWFNVHAHAIKTNGKSFDVTLQFIFIEH